MLTIGKKKKKLALDLLESLEGSFNCQKRKRRIVDIWVDLTNSTVGTQDMVRGSCTTISMDIGMLVHCPYCNQFKSGIDKLQV